MSILRAIIAYSLIAAIAGCVSANQAAICDGTKASRSELADALVAGAPGAPDRVILRGAVLIAQIDAACQDQ
jgi:hypothetical protein